MKKLFLLWCVSLLASVADAQPVADYVLVEKSKNLLSLYKDGKAFASYHVVFGGNPVGHKLQEGDEKTPEGRYSLDGKNAKSAYYKSIHISYPNAADRAQAKARGVSAGGAVMIHGQKNGFAWLTASTQTINWTLGCIALSNSDMDQVWQSIALPTPIEIKP